MPIINQPLSSVKAGNWVHPETRQDYARYARPGVATKLAALGLDIEYTSAQGNYLTYCPNQTHTANQTHRANSEPIAVLDALGGYGANIFGHLHPELTDTLRQCLNDGVPFLAQMSVRPNVAHLSKRLNQILHERTKQDWVSLIYSTGADAVEASLKHAEMRRLDRLDRKFEEFKHHTLRLKQEAQRKPDIMHPLWRHQANELFGLGAIECESENENTIDRSTNNTSEYSQHDAFLALINQHQSAMSARPYCLALERGYHGKSNGALHLTSSEKYRSPFKALAHSTQFVKPDDEAALEAAIDRAKVALPVWFIDEGKWNVKVDNFANVSALYVEPLQGEGGIHPLSERFLMACRTRADEYGFQLVFDEIQSGMGRTGRFFYSEHFGIWADVYLLSKSLGGGLSKVSAACVRRSQYLDDFDELHSSTFAEDDHSAALALKALELVTQNSELMSCAIEQGAYLKAELHKIKSDYPGIIADVRGLGLFLGVEFASQIDSEFFILRVLSEQKLLGYLVTGYMLYEHQVRVASTLADNFVLRIEPSFYITHAECDRIALAIRHVAQLMHHGNVFGMAKYLVGKLGQAEPFTNDASFIDQGNGRIAPPAEHAVNATFATNIVDVNVMTVVEPSLALFEEADLQALCDRIFPVLGPTILSCQRIQSSLGKTVNLYTAVVMYDTNHALGLLENKQTIRMVSDLKHVLKNAESQTHMTLGLGAYTSICSLNGTALNSDSVCITTGNALTVAAGVQSLINEAKSQHIDLTNVQLGIVGAVGNIASMYSEILAKKVSRILLIGRNKSDARLSRLVTQLYVEAAKRLQKNFSCRDAIKTADGTHGAAAGIDAAISASQTFANYANSDLSKRKNARSFVQDIEQELGDEAPISVSDSLNALRDCELVLCASNASDPIVFPSHLATDKQAIVCDISVPVDVSNDVIEQCPNITVLAGGLFNLPEAHEFKWLGFTELASGEAYACMTETMLLALEGQSSHGSYGLITDAQVDHVSTLAIKHGFKVKARHLSHPNQTVSSTASSLSRQS